MKALSVHDFLLLVNETLRLIPAQDFVIVGEISDWRVSQDKWINFDLKDEEMEAKVPCFAVKARVGVELAAGMRVQVRGQARVFERFGKFSLNVDEITPVGEGALQKAYLLLKQKLTNEGLFSAERKRSLPYLPHKIGLITSKDAAAYGDFLRVLSNRLGGMEIRHINVHVQGREAVDDILRAFTFFNDLASDERPEVLVLTRGGGGLEDLHAFNDERVARAIFSSVIPVIVGVGHERDESLADLVADVRASTPSNAAERLVPDRRELLEQIIATVDRQEFYLRNKLSQLNSQVKEADGVFERYFNKIITLRAKLSDDQRLREVAMLRFFERLKSRIETVERVLASLNPRQVLLRGYAIIRSGGRVFTGQKPLALGSVIEIQLAQTSLQAEIIAESQKKLF